MREGPSRLYRLIEARLDGTLADLVAARRPETSWRDIAEEVYEKTGIEVSYEAVRGWFADRIEVRAFVHYEPVGTRGAA